MSETFDKIKEIVCNQLEVEPERVLPTTHFENDLKADSLDVVELVMAIEEAFEVDIDDEAAGNIFTVQDVLDYIDGNQK